jgi:FlaA1/EpsC-like NDP-sugar epimerase
MNPGRKPHKLPPIRNRYFFIADVLVLIPLSAVLSFLLRLDVTGLVHYWGTLAVFAVLAIAIKPLVFFLFGLYRRFWQYASIRELLIVALATMSGTTAVALLMYSMVPLFYDFRLLPRSIPIIDWLVSLAFVGGVRFTPRLMADTLIRLSHDRPTAGRPGSERRALIMGAGDAGSMIVREMQANPGLGLTPVGLLDDDQTKVGLVIHGVPVRGTRSDIPALVDKEQIDEVIIAMPTAPGQAIGEIVAICQKAGVAYKTMPGMYELISGHVSVKQIREVRIEDLLRRQPVRIDGTEAGRYLADAVVLVTGAGGSIGSELSRQIAAYHPRQLLLLGHGENSIYHILQELGQRFPTLAMQPLIADIRDSERLTALIHRHKPGVVFHAAAHKHVPLMELNVTEAVTNNVLGTHNLLQIAEAEGVERFVLISTDKAVNPVNMMGATKRLAELMVQDTAQRTGRAYVAVRFGNVLGSRGSVIPLFQRQIASGGPVTVTDPEVQRYFMTIPEAVQLVIQAAALGKGGEIFVLDMGEQVYIIDLAKELIHLSGLEPERDIEIVFTGLRPGEKVSEELFAASEEPCPTPHEKILVAYGNHTCDSATLVSHLQELERLAKTGDAARIRAKMQEIMPEYRPDREPAERGAPKGVYQRRQTQEHQSNMAPTSQGSDDAEKG